jgi:hypothetical protein
MLRRHAPDGLRMRQRTFDSVVPAQAGTHGRCPFQEPARSHLPMRCETPHRHRVRRSRSKGTGSRPARTAVRNILVVVQDAPMNPGQIANRAGSGFDFRHGSDVAIGALPTSPPLIRPPGTSLRAPALRSAQGVQGGASQWLASSPPSPRREKGKKPSPRGRRRTVCAPLAHVRGSARAADTGRGAERVGTRGGETVMARIDTTVPCHWIYSGQ